MDGYFKYIDIWGVCAWHTYKNIQYPRYHNTFKKDPTDEDSDIAFE